MGRNDLLTGAHKVNPIGSVAPHIFQRHDGLTLTDSGDEARSAGRGLVAIAAAKVFFIIASYSVQLVLPRLWDAHEFGLYSAAMAGVSILNNVLIAATIQSVSKFVSEDDNLAANRLRQGLRIQLIVSAVLGATFFLGAPSLASFLGDPQLGPLFQIAAIVVFSYGLYAALVGSLNGRRLFQRQAGLDITFSTMRTAAILTTAALGFGVAGAISGFAGAAAGILMVALLVVGIGSKGDPIPLRRWVGFMAPIWLYQAFLNGMLQADLLVIKKTLTEIMIAGGMVAAASAESADTYVAYYRSAQTFAFVPYQLMLSMTFIVFPMISRATSAGDVETTRKTIRAAMRFSCLVLLSIAAPISGAADGVMLIAYPEAYVQTGAPALRILVFGMAAFALFVIAATIISGAGKPAISAAIACVSVILIISLNRFLIQEVEIGPETLPTAATATSIGTTLAMFVAVAIVHRLLGASLPALSVLRCLVAACVAFMVANFIPHTTRLMAIAALASGFFAYLGVLALLRELTPQDLQAVRRIIKR